MVEPIQGEGGVNLPPPGYLQGLRELCDRHGLLLIFDEVQTGMGRTGKWYAHQHWSVTPDIVTLAKSIGGGIALGGMLARPEVAEYLKPGTHAATFGGNPVSCRAALAMIETIEADDLLERASVLAQRFRGHFERLRQRTPLIADVRILGVMIGVELTVEGAAIVQKCLERGLLINCTHQTVLRLLPALNLSDELVDEGCELLAEVILGHTV
jgi:acetylornithine/N-succinyldiaminopimelate aminotransferase